MIRAKQVTPDELERLMKRGWTPHYDDALVLRCLFKISGDRCMKVYFLDLSLGHAPIRGKQVWCTLELDREQCLAGGHVRGGVRVYTQKQESEYATATAACHAWERHAKELGYD